MDAHAPLADRLHHVMRSARHRNGFLSADDLQRHGFSPSSVSRLVQRRLLERVATGWYRSTALPWTHDDRVRQADLIAGPEGSLAALSALHWFGVGDRPPVIWLTTPRHRRPRVQPRRLIQSNDLGPVDRRIHRSVRVTSPPRSLIDAARLVTVDELNDLISRTVTLGLATEIEIARRFLELARRGRPGVATMRRALATRSDLVGPSATTFEQALERLIARAGVPKALRQYHIIAGEQNYYLDHAWPEHHCWSECDSMLAHSSPEQLAADLERQNRIVAATGWHPVRFTYRDVHDRPAYVVDQLRRFLPATSSL